MEYLRMKHEFIGNPVSLGISLWEIKIRLIPANDMEARAIKNVETDKANEAERELIDNYLLFGITGWSTLSIKNQNGAIFKLKATNI
jgi:hypothetical protein